MNKAQRKQLRLLREQSVQLTSGLEAVKDELEEMRDEEQDKLDNLPESLLGSCREDEFQNGINALDVVVDGLDSALTSLEDANEAFEEMSL